MVSSYATGTAGTFTLTAGYRLRAVFCHATSAGSLVIGSGSNVITVPAGASFNEKYNDGEPVPSVDTIVFTGTDSYYVRYEH